MDINWQDLNVLTSTFTDSTIELHIQTSDEHGDGIQNHHVLHLSKGNAKWLRDALDAAIKLNQCKAE